MGDIRRILGVQQPDKKASPSDQPRTTKTSKAKMQKAPEHPFIKGSAVTSIAPTTRCLIIDPKDSEYNDTGRRYLPSVALYTPFPMESDRALEDRFNNAISALSLPAFPKISEDRYYAIHQIKNLYIRWSFEEFVEMVDLAIRHDFNFVVVADRLAGRRFDPLVCLEAFVFYCDAILVGSGSYMFQCEDKGKYLFYHEAFKTAVGILAYYKGNQAFRPERIDDELTRQYNVRLAFAATSPIRVFNHINAAVADTATRAAYREALTTVDVKRLLGKNMADEELDDILPYYGTDPNELERERLTFIEEQASAVSLRAIKDSSSQFLPRGALKDAVRKDSVSYTYPPGAPLLHSEHYLFPDHLVIDTSHMATQDPQTGEVVPTLPTTCFSTSWRYGFMPIRMLGRDSCTNCDAAWQAEMARERSQTRKKVIADICVRFHDKPIDLNAFLDLEDICSTID